MQAILVGLNLCVHNLVLFDIYGPMPVSTLQTLRHVPIKSARVEGSLTDILSLCWPSSDSLVQNQKFVIQFVIINLVCGLRCLFYNSGLCTGIFFFLQYHKCPPDIIGGRAEQQRCVQFLLHIHVINTRCS